MKKIQLVGIGPGNLKYISINSINILKSSDILIGSERQLSAFRSEIGENQKIYIISKLDKMIDYIKDNMDKKISVLVSGDTGFYSIVPYILKHFEKKLVEIHPSISSYQYLFSKLFLNWQNYKLASLHGKHFDYLSQIQDYKIEGIVLLTDSKNTPYEIAKNLYLDGNRNLEIIVGENLSYENEKITIEKLENYEKLNRTFDMNILVIRKEENYAHL